MAYDCELRQEASLGMSMAWLISSLGRNPASMRITLANSCSMACALTVPFKIRHCGQP